MMASSASILSSAGARFSYSPSSFDAVQRQNPSSAQMPLSSSRRSSSFAVKAEGEGGSRSSINPDIRKSEAKVVDNVLVSNLEKPLTAYCRCWRSGTFPLCDGSHVKHNKANGDNVGPLLLKK